MACNLRSSTWSRLREGVGVISVSAFKHYEEIRPSRTTRVLKPSLAGVSSICMTCCMPGPRKEQDSQRAQTFKMRILWDIASSLRCITPALGFLGLLKAVAAPNHNLLLS